MSKNLEKNFNNEDDELVSVDLPVTDNEIFTHLLTGKKPERPVIMKKSEVKPLRRIAGTILLTQLLLTGGILYDHINKEYDGSLKKAYSSFTEPIKKWPARMWNTF